MKAYIQLALCAIFALALVWGFEPSGISAQQLSRAGQSSENLPPDIHPDTLSRMPRTKRTDFVTEEERQAFDRMITRSPKQLTSRWLGPTGHRLPLIDVAEIYNKQLRTIREKAQVEGKYLELAVLVATREAGGKGEWLDHVPDGNRLLGENVVDVVRNRRDTNGLEEKQATIIKFGRELFNQPKVSSKTFADAERLFGKRDTLLITLLMAYYDQSEVLSRAYDQHTDTRPDCVRPHEGCDIGKKQLSGTW